MFWTGLQAMIAHAIQGRDIERAGTLLQLGPTINLKIVYACSDGLVVLLANGSTMPALVPWMAEEGAVPESWVTDEDWPRFDLNFLTGQPTAHTSTKSSSASRRWVAKYSKQQLLERGLAAGVTIVPVTTVADVLAFDHLEERKFWNEHELAPGWTVRAPGSFVKATATPPAVVRGTPGRASTLRKCSPQRLAAPGTLTNRPGLPLEGLKVADFAWIGVGPITGKYLADHGANVVRVESASPPDRLRVLGPFTGGVPGTNRSQFFARSTHPSVALPQPQAARAAQDIAKKLIAWADVGLESFTPGTMADLGLGYDVAKELNPSVIYASTCLMGQTGPAAPLAGYGYHAAAISGFYEITGWPDRPPSGPFTAYTDTVAPRFLATAARGDRPSQPHRRRPVHRAGADGIGAPLPRARTPGLPGERDDADPCRQRFPVRRATQRVHLRRRRRVVRDRRRDRGPVAGAASLLCDRRWVMEPAYATLEGRVAHRREMDEHLRAGHAARNRWW